MCAIIYGVQVGRGRGALLHCFATQISRVRHCLQCILLQMADVLKINISLYYYTVLMFV